MVIVIGGGASGLMAAITAAKSGAKVTLIEHKDRVGKKILMTGNGKCNLTNVSDMHGKYYGDDMDRIYAILEQFPADKTRTFFEQIGLYTKEKRDGGIYPVSEQAACVLDALRTECEHQKVNILTDTEVIDIVPNEQGGMIFVEKMLKEEVEPAKSKKGKNAKKVAPKMVVVGSEKMKLCYDSLILATGGQAAAVSGSDGSGYKLAKKLGHRIIKPLPALVQLLCEGEYFKIVAGVRTQAALKLYIHGELKAKEEGELQLTDYGISGIPVFQFSRIVARAIYEQQMKKEQVTNAVIVNIDFLTYMSEEMLASLKQAKVKFAHKTLEEFLSGLVHKKIALLICHKMNRKTNVKLEQMSEEAIYDCIDCLRNFEVTVIGTNSYDSAQVCSGGIPLCEISDSMESVICPHIYMVGELLDCDGICGGYNLQWAWATGNIAGKCAAQVLNE